MPLQSASYFPPSGVDRADGVGNFPGTPTPAGVITINTPNGSFDFIDVTGNGNFFEEYPDSPEIERAEQATITHKWCCDAETANTLIQSIYRGVLLMDVEGNTTRVLSSKISYKKGGYCDFTVVSEGTNFDPPPDEFTADIVELNPGLDKHPRYAILTYHERYLIKSSANTNDLELASSIFSSISSSFSSSHLAPGQELLNKFSKGEESFYLPGVKITWSQYFWAPQYMNPGGFIEDPITSGALPYFFWSTNTLSDDVPDPNVYSIFSQMKRINPNIYAGGISWLRQADTLTLQRTWWRLTRTWLGGPLGKWDAELYTVSTGSINSNPPYGLPYNTDPNSGGLTFNS